MPLRAYVQMKTYMEFGEIDEANVTSLARPLAPMLPRVADCFYETIRSNEDAMRIFTNGAEQLTLHREKLLTWLEQLFSGPYDVTHFERCIRIGFAHVEASLPQHYMILGMDVIRRNLEAEIEHAGVTDAAGKTQSLSKLLAIELSAMMEAYKTHYSARIRHSEREAMEERLTKAEHMAHLGRLAASLAHAIKNPLAGISGAIQIIRGTLSSENPHRLVIDQMLAQIDRLDATVKDLLVYSRPRAPARISVDLNELISRVLNVLREEPTLRRVRVRHIRKNAIPRIQADERHLEQVVMNLLLNAADASSEGERVTITTLSDGCIRMEIADNGIGMTPEVLNRAFEPFHTTKTKGTGLGLSICKQIVDAHGGSIHIQSRRHVGTTVVVELPIEASDKRTMTADDV
jgi:signal transduction histidine kinase